MPQPQGHLKSQSLVSWNLIGLCRNQVYSAFYQSDQLFHLNCNPLMPTPSIADIVEECHFYILSSGLYIAPSKGQSYLH